MKKILFALTSIAALASFAPAQDDRTLPPVAMWGSPHAGSSQSGIQPVGKAKSVYPPFCRRKVCLYYAGDFDSSWTGANGLFNANDPDAGLEGQVWVGVKPDHDATVTGVTFVEWLTSGFTDTEPTPFAVQVGIKPGQAGKTVCGESGNATIRVYGESDGGPLGYSYRIKKLSQPCHLRKNHVYYVNLLPSSDDGYGYLQNLPPEGAPNHHGWKTDLNDCYFNGPVFGSDYVTCNSQGTFPAFSIALTGKERK